MCRLVVWAGPDTNGHKNGDVIDAVDDGVFLGKDIEAGYPSGASKTSWWRVVEMPGVSRNDASVLALLARDPNPGAPLRRAKLDLASIETAAGKPAIGATITTTKTAITTATSTKAVVGEAIIG